jgi:hypothetical protein
MDLFKDFRLLEDKLIGNISLPGIGVTAFDFDLEENDPKLEDFDDLMISVFYFYGTTQNTTQKL